VEQNGLALHPAAHSPEAIGARQAADDRQGREDGLDEVGAADAVADETQGGELLGEDAAGAADPLDAREVGGRLEDVILRDGAFAGVARGRVAAAPGLGVVGGARVDLHVVPVVGVEALEHGGSEALGRPFAPEVVAPEAGRRPVDGRAG